MSNATRPRILAAVPPEAIKRLTNAVGEEFELVFCHSLPTARRCLAEEGVALILGCLHFDDSQVFDLLRIVKGDPATASLPFVCVKAFDGILPGRAYASVEKAARLLGATGFVDFAMLRTTHGKLAAAAILRERLNVVLKRDE